MTVQSVKGYEITALGVSLSSVEFPDEFERDKELLCPTLLLQADADPTIEIPDHSSPPLFLSLTDRPVEQGTTASPP